MPLQRRWSTPATGSAPAPSGGRNGSGLVVERQPVMAGRLPGRWSPAPSKMAPRPGLQRVEPHSRLLAKSKAGMTPGTVMAKDGHHGRRVLEFGDINPTVDTWSDPPCSSFAMKRGALGGLRAAQPLWVIRSPKPRPAYTSPLVEPRQQSL